MALTIYKHWFLVLFLGLVLGGHSAGALEFSYKFRVGDKYRVISTVSQDIFVDRKLSYRAEIFNRIAVEVSAISGGRARLQAVFQSAEKTAAVGGRNAEPFQWSKDYRSEYEQNNSGNITIDDQYYMPMVRDVPVFPGRNLNAGDVWTAEGVEVHDFTDSFGIEKPYRIPFTASYTYLGGRTWKEKEYPAFSVSYRIFLEPEAVPGKVFPRRIQGGSDQIIYWDTDIGQAVAYEEFYRTIFDLSDGQIWEYRGSAEAEIVDAMPMNKEEMAQEIAEEIREIPDTSVRVSEEGIVIGLGNVQFAPDSTVLGHGELSKLDKIADILMQYPDRDILVGGHTVFSGTAEERLKISTERAAAVAEYLLRRNVRTPDRVVIRGFGAEQPISDNSTWEDIQRNRRVEITILEN